MNAKVGDILRDKKKILIVSRSFYPVNSPRSFRTTELVKEFARRGHEVTLLTERRDDIHSAFEKEHGITIKGLGPQRFQNIELHSRSSAVRFFKRILRRGLYQLFEYPDIELMYRVKKALASEIGYDLLISIAVPHPIHWGVSWAWKNDQPIAKTWVADCGDPFMGAALDSFNKMFYFKYFEKSFCHTAHYISVPIEGAKDGYYPEFRDKIKVIPQGFKFDELITDPNSHPSNKVPTFAYAGGLIPGGRDPRVFLDYLTSLDWDYKFLLFTKNRELIQPYLDRVPEKIVIRDYLPRKELLHVLSGMDFLINFENETTLQLPSKLIDYYLTGRPVLSVSSSDINKSVINEFLCGNYANRHQFDDMEQYRIENVCDRFLQLCYHDGEYQWKA